MLFNLLDLQKICKNRTKNSHISFPQEISHFTTFAFSVYMYVCVFILPPELFESCEHNGKKYILLNDHSTVNQNQEINIDVVVL